MRINNCDVKNYMTLNFKFSGTRIFDTMLTPVNWEISVNVLGIDADNASGNAIQEQGSIAYQKLYFYLESNLSNVVICDVNDELGFNVANCVDNMMMYCPGEASDDLIIQMLHAKLCAIAGKYLHVGEMKLSSSDSSATYIYNGPDKNQGVYLPKNTADYIDTESLYEKPWWTRNDGFCFEFIRTDPTDETPLKTVYKDVIDPLKEYEKSLLIEFSDLFEESAEPAEIIKVAAWIPQKV